jgi:hypothetical protein
MRDCDAELGALGRVEAEDSGYRAGEAWGWWIWCLTTIFNKAGLPTGARKDDAEATSSFVNFIAGLQTYLPEPFRRRIHSKPAFAKAIGKARAEIPGFVKERRFRDR